MNDLAFLTLSDGGFVVVDAHRFQELNNEKWRALSKENRHVYSCRGMESTTGYQVSLASVVNRTPEGFDTHHKNGDLRDYTERNLETVTRSVNMAHRPKTKGHGNYKGVFRSWKVVKCMTQIEHQGVKYHLGNWETNEEAAHAYDHAFKKFFGSSTVGLNNVRHLISDEQARYVEWKVESLIRKRKSALLAKGIKPKQQDQDEEPRFE